MLRLKIVGFVATNTARDVPMSHPRELAFGCHKHSWNLLYKYIYIYLVLSHKKRLESSLEQWSMGLWPSCLVFK